MTARPTWRPLLGLLLLLPCAGGCGSSFEPGDAGAEGDGAVEGGGGPDAALEAGAPCVEDRQCDDGRFCNGVERCVEGGDAGAGPRCRLPEQPACPRRSCDEEADRCEIERGWVVVTQELGGQLAYDLALAGDGTLFVTGRFTKSIDLGDGPLSGYNLTNRVFVASFDASGSHRWSAAFGGEEGAVGTAIGLDAETLYVAGGFGGTIDFGEGVHESAGDWDIFVTSLTREGATAGSRTIGGPEGQGVSSLVLSPDGALTLAGSVTGPVDFGGGLLEPSSRASDAFLASYDAAGAHRWSGLFGERGSNMVEDLAADAAGNVYAVGEFLDVIDFGGGPLDPVSRARMGFVASLTAEGEQRWARALEAFVIDVSAVAVTPEGRLYVTGFFSETLELEEGVQLDSHGEWDVFVLALEPDGTLRWARRFGGAGQDEAFDVAVDERGHVYVSGQLRGRVDLGGGPLGREDDLRNGFVMSLTAAGEHRWSMSMGTPVQLYGLAAGVDGRLYATGSFNGLLEWNDERHWSADGEIDFILMQLLEP